jgi:hypothetical protein
MMVGSLIPGSAEFGPAIVDTWQGEQTTRKQNHANAKVITTLERDFCFLIGLAFLLSLSE